MDLSMQNNYAHQNGNQCANELSPFDCTRTEPNLLNEETISCDENEPEINIENISNPHNITNNAIGKRTYSQMKIESVSEGENYEYNACREQNWAINPNAYTDRTSTPFNSTSELMPAITEEQNTPNLYVDNLSTPLLPSNMSPSTSAYRSYSPYMYADRSPPALSAANHGMFRALTPSYPFVDRSPSQLSATDYNMPRTYTPHYYADRSPSALTATNNAMPSESAYPTTTYPLVGYSSTAMVPMNEIMPPPLSPSPAIRNYFWNLYCMTYNLMMSMLPIFNTPSEGLTLDVYTDISHQAIYLAELVAKGYQLN